MEVYFSLCTCYLYSYEIEKYSLFSILLDYFYYGLQISIVVVDMPYGSYESSQKKAYNNAIKILDISGAHAVKLEGGESIWRTVEYLTKKKYKCDGTCWYASSKT